MSARDERGAGAGHLADLFGRDALYTALWAVQLLTAALVTPFATRLMDSEQFGTLAAANAVMQVLFVLAGAGLATALQREHAHRGARRARVVLAIAVAAALLVGLLAHVTGPLWAPALGLPSYDLLVQLSVAWATASAITNAGLAQLRSQDRLGAFVVVSLLQSVLAEAASLALLVAVPGSGATGFVVGQLSMQLVALAAVLVMAPPAVPRSGELAGVRAVLAFALPLVPVSLSGLVLATADRLVLQALAGPQVLGGYQVAVNIASAPVLLLGVLTTSWLPRLFALGDDQAATLAAARDAVLRLLVPVVVGLAVGGPVVMSVWAPSSYGTDALAMTFAVVVISAVPFAAGQATTRRLVVAGRTGVVAWSTAVAAVTCVVANLLLVPSLSALGAAVSAFLAYTAQAAVLRWAARSTLRAEPPAPRDVAALALACTVAVLSAEVPTHGSFVVIRLAVAVLMLGALALLVHRLRASAPAPALTSEVAP